MSEQKFDPVQEFVSLRDSLSKTVGNTIRTATGLKTSPDFPAVDIYETDELLVVVTESLLGANSDSFEISVEENILTITGETVSPLEIEDAAYLHKERQFGVFKREVRLPRKVAAQKAKASFKSGVLTITFPKAAQEGSQIIAVTPAE